MSYITGYLRKNRKRQLEAGNSESQVESAPANSNDPVFQIDYATWYASLAGWSPIPMHSAGTLLNIKAAQRKVSKAA